MAALGPAGVKFEEATRLMTNAKTGEEKENAKAALERAQAAINQRMASKEYNDMMQYGTAEQKAAIAGQVQGYEGLQGAQKAAQDAGGDYVQALKNQKAEAAAAQKGQKVDADGKPITDGKGAAVMDEGAKTAQALNMANRQATIMAGGMAQQLEKTNASLGKSPAAIEAFNNSLKYVGSAKTMEQGQKQIEKAPADAVKAFTGSDQAPSEKAKTGSTGGKIQKLAEGGVVEPTSGGSIVNVGEGGKAEAVIPLDKLKDVIGNVASTVSSATGSGVKSTESSAPKIKDSTTAVFEKSIELYKVRLEKAVESGNAAKIALETKVLERNQQALAAYTQQQLEKREGIEKLGFDAYYAKINQAKTMEAAAKVMSADELMALDKANADKVKEAKVMSADELIALDKANIVKTTTAKATESVKPDSGGLFDMLNPKIINQKAADLQKAATSQTAPKTTEAAPKTAEIKAKKELSAEEQEQKRREEYNNMAKNGTGPGTGGGEATLKDLKDQLVTLNKNMLQLINHSESTADAAQKTARSTAKATGARGG